MRAGRAGRGPKDVTIVTGRRFLRFQAEGEIYAKNLLSEKELVKIMEKQEGPQRMQSGQMVQQCY